MTRILLFLGIFTLPFSFDYTLFMVPMDEHSGWANGFLITLSDLFFLALFIMWKIQYFTEYFARKRIFFIYPILFFLGACVFSAIWAIWRLFSYFEILQYCKIAFLYFYVPLVVLQDEDDIKFVCHSLLVTLLFQSVLAIVQFSFQDFYNFMRTGGPVKLTLFGDFIRSQGTVGQPNAFAALIIPLLLLNQIFLLSPEDRSRTLYYIIMFIGLTALVFTFSRAGWIGFIFAVLSMLIMRRGGGDPCVTSFRSSFWL